MTAMNARWKAAKRRMRALSLRFRLKILKLRLLNAQKHLLNQSRKAVALETELYFLEFTQPPADTPQKPLLLLEEDDDRYARDPDLR